MARIIFRKKANFIFNIFQVKSRQFSGSFKIKKIESDLIVGRVLARASGTENVIRIMVESESKETAEKYSQDILAFFVNENHS